MGTESYTAGQATRFTSDDCDSAVGKRATLTLTGAIVESGESESGPYVMFEVDGRWGFAPGQRFGMDLDCFELEA